MIIFENDDADVVSVTSHLTNDAVKLNQCP